VARYLEARDSRIAARIREFSARGDLDYDATARDNSPDERAVEVHVHFVQSPPPIPENVQPLRPLPGGARASEWSVAAPFGITVSVFPGVVLAVNCVVFRCREGAGATHVYWTPGAGAGVSYAGPQLSKIKDMIKGMLGNLTYTGMSFTDCAAVTPFNFKDLSGATCELRGVGAGVGIGYLLARVSVRAQVWYRESNGKPMFGMRELVTSVDASGKDLQLGVGGSVVGGPLIRLD
jgi:hypothetical protein